MKAYRIVVKGVVQGIGYRYFTRTTANRIGISGWVRNCPDGSVEIHGEGDEPSLHKFLAEIRRGPAGLVVDSFEVDEIPPVFLFGFEIRS